MAEITAAAVKELREKCGLPMMDCKKALGESDGDVDAAIQWLRERGAQILAKRADRETTYGRFGIYTSIAGGQGAMVGADVRECFGHTERGVHPAGQ